MVRGSTPILTDDVLALKDGSVLRSGSNSLMYCDTFRQLDLAMTEVSGVAVSANADTALISLVAASVGSAGGDSSAVFAPVPTLANSNSTSSQGHHFALGTITVNLTGPALSADLMYARAAMPARAQICHHPLLAYPEQDWPRSSVRADTEPTKTRNASREKLKPDSTAATLGARDAAAFCGLSLNTFLREVTAGTLPKPIPLVSRRRLWSRATLNSALAGDVSPRTRGLTIAEAIDAYEV